MYMYVAMHAFGIVMSSSNCWTIQSCTVWAEHLFNFGFFRGWQEPLKVSYVHERDKCHTLLKLCEKSENTTCEITELHEILHPRI